MEANRLRAWKGRSSGRKAASARALRATFTGGGVVATVAGLHGVLFGARTVPGVDRAAHPDIESELRFFAAFYAAYGLSMLAAAPRVDRDRAAVNGLAGALFLAGVARLAGWASVGRPNPTQLGLLAIELGAPPVVALWRSRLD